MVDHELLYGRREDSEAAEARTAGELNHPGGRNTTTTGVIDEVT
jgi:hypothetical protein